MGSILLLLAFSFVNPQQQSNVDAYFLWQNAMQQSGQPVYGVNPYNNLSTQMDILEARYQYWQQQIQMQEGFAEQYAITFYNTEKTYNAKPTQQNYDNMMQAHAAFMRQYQIYQNIVAQAQRETRMEP